MSQTVLRYIKMLQLIPRNEKGVTVSELHTNLMDLDFVIDKRGVERDLNTLSGSFPITCSEPRPARWRWMAGSPQMNLPGLDPATALTYELVSRHLAALLPRRLLLGLEPQFAAARHVLDESRTAALGRWSTKIAVIPDGQPLLPPTVAADVTEVVYEALLANRRFEVSYRAIGVERAKRYPINPLGLVLQAGALYLVATARDYEDPHVFALHRMSNPKALDETASTPAGFDLTKYIREERTFEHPHGHSIRLHLRLSPWLARQLDERRLAEDQVIAPIKGSAELLLQVTVAETDQLYWWLRSFGTEVEVVKPVGLRRRLAAESAELARKYARS